MLSHDGRLVSVDGVKSLDDKNVMASWAEGTVSAVVVQWRTRSHQAESSAEISWTRKGLKGVV